ncbi:formate/nitrite transporter family protein [Phaeobacter italicus]|jgi:formate/nitrite transporter FocA (FNT family)|uniref:formate/nitrite transporter family protein n=1 Tax=Phaeobacter italicus TaxID=481446 RepID=UPI001C9827F5|nr:formate/nitrite transporter family protein [Phaeobacter italicus]MEC8015646.1 formate/nitrite transporter family protein [Pseudomonadota bacterium]MBY5975876.1 formate/nitrite transporter family protein [Phaeobacter italicus]MCA0857555.1 formate/nitrite transporter family protein [Phaeobacter italicus]MCI5101142.1 formate/nitrite transporter family protein [Phaeobacter italicus]MEC8572065.1 formate/nitrite transporter family protein [Pseudomonadota bacterium]
MAIAPQTDELIEEEAEREIVEEGVGISPRLIFETIRREGEEELERPVRALWWSGIAAGILISFSVLGKSLFRAYLPEADWTPLVENLGYSLGFLMVILGRMQLFTENTITTVVPVVLRQDMDSFVRTARLWGIVLGANVVGAFVIAAFFGLTPVLKPELLEAMIKISEHATGMEPMIGLISGIPSGILIAAIVWMMPSAANNKIVLVVIFTWLIAAGDFTHIVAGSVEMALLLLLGELGIGQAVFGFFLPVLIGNVIGGTVVFTLLTYAQIRPEIRG